MSRIRGATRCFAGFAAVIFLLVGYSAWAVGAARADLAPLQGKWLPLSARGWNSSMLGEIRNSVLTIGASTFSLSRYRGMPKPVTGTFTVDSATEPGHIDLNTDEIDVKNSETEWSYPASRLPGIYKLQGNLLTIRFGTGSAPTRPKDFTSHSDGAVLLVVQRPDPDFKSYPDTVKLTVLDPNGKPAPHEKVFQFISQRIRTKAATQPTCVYVGWTAATQPVNGYLGTKQTAADGTLTLPYDESSRMGVRDAKRKLIGFTITSPALLQKGVAVLQLEPECLLTGTLTCKELSKAGSPLGPTNVYLMRDGEILEGYACTDGRFEFPVPPGDYVLDAYGTNLKETYVPHCCPVRNRR